MIDSKLYAWIFLTTGEKQTSLSDVLWSADAINRAVPELEELQMSLGWLQAQGLVKKEGKNYLYSGTGAMMYKSNSGGNIFDVWDEIAQKFTQFPEIDFQLEEITEKEIVNAEKVNKKRFKELIQKLNEEKNTNMSL